MPCPDRLTTAHASGGQRGGGLVGARRASPHHASAVGKAHGHLTLPEGVDRRLHALLDKQDRGEALTDDERAEAEGLVDLADLLSLLKLRAR